METFLCLLSLLTLSIIYLIVTLCFLSVVNSSDSEKLLSEDKFENSLEYLKLAGAEKDRLSFEFKYKSSKSKHSFRIKSFSN